MYRSDNIELDFEAIAKVNETTAYASSGKFNALFEVKLNTGECKYIGVFQGENISGKRIHAAAIYINDSVYFIPASGRFLSVFRLNTGKIERLNFDVFRFGKSKYPFFQERFKFADAFLQDNNIWVIPSTYPGVLKIDTKTDRIHVFDNWVPDERVFFRKGVLLEDHIFYVPSAGSNVILTFDIKKGIGEISHIGNDNESWWSICRHGDVLWLAPKAPGSIVAWDPLSKKVKKYDKYPVGFDGKNFAFTKIYSYRDNIFLIPAYANMYLKVTADTGEITACNEQLMNGVTSTGFMFELDSYYYLVFDHSTKRYRYRLNLITNQLEEYRFFFAEGYEKRNADYLKESVVQNCVIRESALFRLQDYMDGTIINDLKD